MFHSRYGTAHISPWINGLTDKTRESIKPDFWSTPISGLYKPIVFSSIFLVISLLVTIPSAQASTGGALDKLGDMLGFDSNWDTNDDNNRASDSDNTESMESTLDIPNITQKVGPTSVPSGRESKEEFAMKAEFRPDELIWSYWDLTGFGLNVSPGSEICRGDNCEFEIEDGQLRPDFAGGYVFEGRLKVGVEEEGGVRSNIYDIKGEMDTGQTF
jgi:hypothetical protein